MHKRPPSTRVIRGWVKLMVAHFPVPEDALFDSLTRRGASRVQIEETLWGLLDERVIAPAKIADPTFHERGRAHKAFRLVTAAERRALPRARTRRARKRSPRLAVLKRRAVRLRSLA